MIKRCTGRADITLKLRFFLFLEIAIEKHFRNVNLQKLLTLTEEEKKTRDHDR